MAMGLAPERPIGLKKQELPLSLREDNCGKIKI
jgi:hypothetical protein